MGSGMCYLEGQKPAFFDISQPRSSSLAFYVRIELPGNIASFSQLSVPIGFEETWIDWPLNSS